MQETIEELLSSSLPTLFPAPSSLWLRVQIPVLTSWLGVRSPSSLSCGLNNTMRLTIRQHWLHHRAAPPTEMICNGTKFHILGQQQWRQGQEAGKQTLKNMKELINTWAETLTREGESSNRPQHLCPMTPAGRKARTRAPISEQYRDVQGRAVLKPTRKTYQVSAALAKNQASALHTPYTPSMGCSINLPRNPENRVCDWSPQSEVEKKVWHGNTVFQVELWVANRMTEVTCNRVFNQYLRKTCCMPVPQAV